MARSAERVLSGSGRALGSTQLSLFDEPLPAAGPRQAVPERPPAAPARPAAPSAHVPGRNSVQGSVPVGGTAAGGADWPRHPRADRRIELSGVSVPFWLRRSRRRSIGFTVGTDGLVVSAPRWVSVGDVEAALRDKAAWVVAKLHDQAARAQRAAAARIDWRDGAEFRFLGEAVRVRLGPGDAGAVLQADAAASGEPTVLRVGLPLQAEPEQIRDVVQSWLQRQALRIFEERCRQYAPVLGVRVRRLSLTAARTRWGSASADGAIRLNWRLVQFRLPTIDYVVVHELAHLREMNHSPAFWEVVRSVMPNFEEARFPLKEDPVTTV